MLGLLNWYIAINDSLGRHRSEAVLLLRNRKFFKLAAWRVDWNRLNQLILERWFRNKGHILFGLMIFFMIVLDFHFIIVCLSNDEFLFQLTPFSSRNILLVHYVNKTLFFLLIPFLIVLDRPLFQFLFNILITVRIRLLGTLVHSRSYHLQPTKFLLQLIVWIRAVFCRLLFFLIVGLKSLDLDRELRRVCLDLFWRWQRCSFNGKRYYRFLTDLHSFLLFLHFRLCFLML